MDLLSEIREKKWKTIQKPQKKTSAKLDGKKAKGVDYWDWEQSEAEKFAESGDDKATIKKKIKKKRDYYGKQEAKQVEAKEKKSAKKSGTFVAPLKRDIAEENRVALLLLEESRLRITNGDTPTDGFTTTYFDPRLLLSSITYPKLNERIRGQTFTHRSQDIGIFSPEVEAQIKEDWESQEPQDWLDEFDDPPYDKVIDYKSHLGETDARRERDEAWRRREDAMPVETAKLYHRERFAEIDREMEDADVVDYAESIEGAMKSFEDREDAKREAKTKKEEEWRRRGGMRSSSEKQGGWSWRPTHRTFYGGLSTDSYGAGQKGSPETEPSLPLNRFSTLTDEQSYNVLTNPLLDMSQGGVNRIYPLPPPTIDDPSTWGFDERGVDGNGEYGYGLELQLRQYKANPYEDFSDANQHLKMLQLNPLKRPFHPIPDIQKYVTSKFKIAFNTGPRPIGEGQTQLNPQQHRELLRRWETKRNAFYNLIPTKTQKNARWLGIENLKMNVAQDDPTLGNLKISEDERYTEEIEADPDWVYTIGSEGGNLYGRDPSQYQSIGAGLLRLGQNQTQGIRQLPPILIHIHTETGTAFIKHKGGKLDYLGKLKFTMSYGAPVFQGGSTLINSDFQTDATHLGHSIYKNDYLNLRGHRYIEINSIQYGVSSGINMRIDHMNYRTHLYDRDYHGKVIDHMRTGYLIHSKTAEMLVNDTIIRYCSSLTPLFQWNNPQADTSALGGSNTHTRAKKWKMEKDQLHRILAQIDTEDKDWTKLSGIELDLDHYWLSQKEYGREQTGEITSAELKEEKEEDEKYVHMEREWEKKDPSRTYWLRHLGHHLYTDNLNKNDDVGNLFWLDEAGVEGRLIVLGRGRPSHLGLVAQFSRPRADHTPDDLLKNLLDTPYAAPLLNRTHYDPWGEYITQRQTPNLDNVKVPDLDDAASMRQYTEYDYFDAGRGYQDEMAPALPPEPINLQFIEDNADEFEAIEFSEGDDFVIWNLENKNFSGDDTAIEQGLSPFKEKGKDENTLMFMSGYIGGSFKGRYPQRGMLVGGTRDPRVDIPQRPEDMKFKREHGQYYQDPRDLFLTSEKTDFTHQYHQKGGAIIGILFKEQEMKEHYATPQRPMREVIEEVMDDQNVYLPPRNPEARAGSIYAGDQYYGHDTPISSLWWDTESIPEEQPRTKDYNSEWGYRSSYHHEQMRPMTKKIPLRPDVKHYMIGRHWSSSHSGNKYYQFFSEHNLLSGGYLKETKDASVWTSKAESYKYDKPDGDGSYETTETAFSLREIKNIGGLMTMVNQGKIRVRAEERDD